MSDNTLVTDNATDATTEQTGNQVQAEKSYSQQEVDNMMARMKGSLEKKLLKPYADLGDPDELRSIKTDWEQKKQEQQINRGEFEKTLQEMAAKKDAEIQKRDTVIKEYKVNTPLLSSAAKYNAVNAEQVKALLAQQVRLNDEGEVEVLDSKGAVRYNDKGSAIGVDDLVREFLDSNPHFKLASPATTNTRSNTSAVSTTSSNKVDLASLDLTRPDHREVYRQAKLKGLL
tara:strand:- start:260 stop:949 length:690 start_codon:yes stop_codon:yes gene_type:complete